MSATYEIDRYAAEWIREVGGSGHADYLEEILERTRRTRQRPAWTSPARWMPTPFADIRIAPRLPIVVRALVLVALLVALTLALIATGGLRRLPPPYGPANNGLMAFDVNGLIYLADADASHPRALTDTAAYDQLPTWSPDGTRLAYMQVFGTLDNPERGAFAIYDVEHGTKLDLPVPGDGTAYWGISWSPDSRSIALSADDHGIPALYILAVDGGGARRVELPNSMRARYPAWSPDGRLLAFSGMTDRFAVWVVGPDGSGLRRLTEPGTDEPGAIAWSPDGVRLVYATNVDASQPRALHVVNADGRADRAITAPTSRVGDPAWSPDGSALAFVRPAPAGSELVVARPDGSVDHVLISGGSITNAPAWSPDGTKLLAYHDVGPGCGTSSTPCDLRLVQIDIASGTIVTMPALAGRPDAPAGYTGGSSSWQRVTAP